MSGQTRMGKSWSILHTFILLFFFLDDHHTGCNARMWRMTAEMEEVAEVVHSSSLSLLHRRQLQSALYCVAIMNADQTQLQAALDWACGGGKVDCSPLQVGGACYNPNTLVGHASYAFNQYYINQNAAPGSCNFNGLANPTTINPSSSTCIYPVYGGSTTTPTSPTTPTTPTTPVTSSPPSVSNGTILSPPTFDTNTTTGTTNASTLSPIVGPPWLHALCGGILLILFLRL